MENLIETKTYKITIREGAADMMLNGTCETLWLSRVSPMVMYAELSDWEAIELAQQEGYEVVHAPKDWSI